MRINKDNEKRIFLLGLAFVVLSYILIQCINNFSIITIATQDILAMLRPFTFAFILAYILYPIVSKIERTFKVRRIYSVLLTYAILISFVTVCINFIIPTVISSISQLSKELPTYLALIQGTVSTLAQQLHIDTNLDLINKINQAILEALPTINSLLAKYLSSAVNTTISVFSTAFNAFITLMSCFYILLEKESFQNTIKLILRKLLKPTTYSTLLNLTRALHTNIGKYLIGKASNSLFVGVTSYIGLSLCKANYAGLLAIMLGLTNMVPYIGPLVGTSIAVALNIFSSPATGIFILVYMFIIQQIESFILEPKTVGKQLGLSPFLTIFAISIGGNFGVVPMILSIPISSLIKTYISKFIESN